MSRYLLCLLTLGCGCAASRSDVATTPAEKPPLTVAVIGFGGSDEVASATEDGCVMAVLEAGLRAVDRARIVAALPNENDVEFSAAGRALGADIIIDGGVARGSVRGSDGEPLRLEPRLISTHSANILGVAQSKTLRKPSRTLGHKLCADLLSQLP